MPPDSNEAEPGSNAKDVSASESKTAWVDLVPYRTWKCVPTVISSGVDISEIRRWQLFKKLLQIFLTQSIVDILSKQWKSDNFEPHNSL